MPDGHSEVEPPLPIPNRIVKRPSADDSAGPGVKVGHRQAMYTEAPYPERCGAFLRLGASRTTDIASGVSAIFLFSIRISRRGHTIYPRTSVHHDYRMPRLVLGWDGG